MDLIKEHHNQLRKCRGGLEKRRPVVRTITSIRRDNDNRAIHHVVPEVIDSRL